MAAGSTSTNEIEKMGEDLANLVLEEEEPDHLRRDLSDFSRALVAVFDNMKHEIMVQECRKNLKEITHIYQNELGRTGRRSDFSDPRKQWSYMYRYMIYHSHLVYLSLKMAVDKRVLEINPAGTPLNVCVIGGGPGSDILGLSLLLHASKCSSQWIGQVDVLDKYIGWENSWTKLYKYLPKEFQNNVKNVSYSKFDFTNRELGEENENRVKAAHIITMTKAVSSVAALLSPEDKALTSSGSSAPQAESNSIHSILNNMQEGAILLYIDNEKGKQTKLLNDAAGSFKFKKLLEDKLGSLKAPEFYEAIDSGFRKEIAWQMCRIAKNESFIILKKPGQLSVDKIVLQATGK